MALVSYRPPTPHRTCGTRSIGAFRRGVTLVELLVVLVLFAVLSSMALAGLNVARRRGRVDATRNTIRKIHELLMPQYESYLRRRVPFAVSSSSGTNAMNRLSAIRTLMVWEMPDSWGDVIGQGSSPYLSLAQSLPATVARSNGNAECLYMIASFGLSEPDAMERFRAEEIGDTDRDGAPEFLDAWRNPIGFIRWAPGVSSPLASSTLGLNSPVQVGDPARFHDPLDPLRVDPLAFAMTPLIFSAGPDGIGGLVTTGTGGWRTYALGTITSGTNPPDGRDLASITGTTCRFQAAGGVLVTGSTPVNYVTGTFVISGTTTIGMPDRTTSATGWADNITNHDLFKK